jgi:hypothetical protein
MGTIITKTWVEDRELEEIARHQQRETNLIIRDLYNGKMPTADEFLRLIAKLADDLNRLQQQSYTALDDLSERLERLEYKERARISVPNLQTLREQSKQRALDLRAKLGLTEDPMKVDGFGKIRGLLKKYAHESEDPVEFLKQAREEE